MRVHETSDQTTSSWTGFNILTSEYRECTSDAIGCLPTINAPVTELPTVQEILRQSVSIRSALQLDNIAVVFDQAWKHPEQYGTLKLNMMGDFHSICNLLSTIGQLFGDAGLRDLAVESGVIAKGSINKVLDGKQNNQAVGLHKLTYETLMRLAWSGFEEWLEAIIWIPFRLAAFR